MLMLQTREDCGFYLWADKEAFDFMKQLLRDLHDAVWGLKKEVVKKEAEVDAKELQLLAKQKEVDDKQKQSLAM